MDPGLHYRQEAARGASPLRLVTMLYEQAIEDLRRALLAQKKGDIEGRTREINHALLVIGHLQASLDPDQGGQVAVYLSRFYNQVRSGLLDAQYGQSAAAIEEQIEHLILVRDAWTEVEREEAEREQVKREHEAGRGKRGSFALQTQPPSSSLADWKA